MKIFSLASLAGLLLCGSGCLSVNSVASPKIAEQLERSIPPPTFIYPFDQQDPYDFVGSFQRENNSLIGGGSLISPNVILTAGHVVDGDDVHHFSIGGVDHEIANIIIHDGYQSVYNTLNYDIAIVILCEPSAVLPVEIYTGNIYQGTPLTTVGFGMGLKRYSNYDTFWYYGRLVTKPWNIIMLPLKDTIWFGDSGGAVICRGQLIGILSSFSIYDEHIYENSATYVPYFNKWIEEVSNGQMDDG